MWKTKTKKSKEIIQKFNKKSPFFLFRVGRVVCNVVFVACLLLFNFWAPALKSSCAALLLAQRARAALLLLLSLFCLLARSAAMPTTTRASKECRRLRTFRYFCLLLYLYTFLLLLLCVASFIHTIVHTHMQTTMTKFVGIHMYIHICSIYVHSCICIFFSNIHM